MKCLPEAAALLCWALLEVLIQGSVSVSAVLLHFNIVLVKSGWYELSSLEHGEHYYWCYTTAEETQEVLLAKVSLQ